MWEIVAPVFSVIAAIVAIYIQWQRWREAQLRLGEVLSWANEVIDELQSLVLVCQLSEAQLEAGKLRDILFKTSILVERGRLFFKNKGSHGPAKWAAYRGNRPKILDPIVTAHQIAYCLRNETNEDAKRRMWAVAEDCRKEFVTLAQKEVGRARAVSVDTSQAGNSIRIRNLLDTVTSQQLAELQPIA
jgi:hypothetical protein